MSPEEAHQLTSQGAAVNTQADTSLRIERAYGRLDPSTLAPPGEDAAAYVRRMTERGAQDFTSASLDSSKITATIPPPSTINIRSAYGSPRVPAAAGPGDVLEITLGNRKVTVEVEEAVRQGLLRHHRDGGYQAVSDTDAQQTKQPEEKKGDPMLEAKRATGDEPDAETNSAIEDIVRSVPAPAIEALARDAIDNGGMSLKSVLDVAERSGLSHDQATSLTTTAVQGLYRQACAAVASQGVPANEAAEAFGWMQEHLPLEHKNASMALIMASEPSGLKELAGKYIAWKRSRS